MIRASSAQNWKTISTSKAVTSRGAADPEMTHASRPLRSSLKVARHTSAKGNQHVVEYHTSIDTPPAITGK
jgi:hypothetical protein